MRVVVTGNIGCGKSTFCQMLHEHLHGHSMHSVDKIVHEGYASNVEFKTGVERVFGTHDRREVAKIAFDNPDKLLELENLSIAVLGKRIDEAFSESHAIIEFPLFFEKPLWKDQADYVIVLGTDSKEQKRRVMERDRISEEEFLKRTSTQIPTERKAGMGDIYIDTGRGIHAMSNDVRKIAEQILSKELKDECNAFFQTATVWEEIERAYSEPHRKYHTLAHLADLWEHLRKFRNEPFFGAVFLALVFHDFIYTTDLLHYGENEAKSAESMNIVVGSLCSSEWIEEHADDLRIAGEIIIATKTHESLSPKSYDNDVILACRRFMDADMAILGSPPRIFSFYDRDIALEWEQDPDNPSTVFNIARRQIIKGFLDVPRLFWTEDFVKFETRAKDNLTSALRRNK